MKNHPAFDCQSLPATAPVEDMAAPQNQIPSSHAKYAGRFETKKRLRLPEGCFRIAHMWLDEKLLGFLENSSLKITFSMDVLCWKSQDRKKTTAKLGEKSTRKIKMWGQWLFFVLGPWRQSVLSLKVTSFPTSPPKKIWQPGNIPILLVAVVQQCCLVFNLPKSEVEDTVVFHLN